MESEVMPDRGRVMTESELRAIARRAADPPAGMVPADVIDQALREAGVPGDYGTSAEYRRLWHRLAGLTCDIFRARLQELGVDVVRTQRRSRHVRRYPAPLAQLAHQVLREAGGPLRLMEVHRRLNQRGWRVSVDSVAGALSRTPRIVRISRGVYAAAEHTQALDESE
jgi:hypothetical protein